MYTFMGLVAHTCPTGGSSGVEITAALLCIPTFSCPSDNIGRDHIGDLHMYVQQRKKRQMKRPPKLIARQS